MPTLVELCGRRSWAPTPPRTGSLASILVEPGELGREEMRDFHANKRQAGGGKGSGLLPG